MVKFLNVVKEYRADGLSVRALDGISLEIEAGSFVALVGRSGCGKTTLLNLAGAMDSPTSGEVAIDGTSTTNLDDTGLTHLRREKIGFIFQSFQLLPTLSVAENVELPLLLARQARRAHGGDSSGSLPWRWTGSRRGFRTNFPVGKCSA